MKLFSTASSYSFLPSSKFYSYSFSTTASSLQPLPTTSYSLSLSKSYQSSVSYSVVKSSFKSYSTKSLNIMPTSLPQTEEAPLELEDVDSSSNNILKIVRKKFLHNTRDCVKMKL